MKNSNLLKFLIISAPIAISLKLQDMVTNFVWSAGLRFLGLIGQGPSSPEAALLSQNFSILFATCVGIFLVLFTKSIWKEDINFSFKVRLVSLLSVLFPFFYALWAFFIFTYLTPQWPIGLGFRGQINLVPVFIAFVLVAPVVEEVLFRGWLFSNLEKVGYSQTKTCFIVASTWAFCHLPHALGFVEVLVLLPFGLILSFARAKTGSIGNSILIHSMTNLLQVLLPAISSIEMWQYLN